MVSVKTFSSLYMSTDGGFAFYSECVGVEASVLTLLLILWSRNVHRLIRSVNYFSSARTTSLPPLGGM